MTVKGLIQNYDGEYLTIVAPLDKGYELERKSIVDCDIFLNDGRGISANQRRKIFALVNDIGDYVAGITNKREYEEMLRTLKLLYIQDMTDKESVRRLLTLKYCELTDRDMFSLSDTDMSTARDFISWLIEKCIDFDIPTNDSLLNLTEEMGRYLYRCVAKRRCAICGKKADIHEVEKVGAGRNRRTIHHLGQQVQPLCRLHHREEERLGQKSFNDKYHIGTIKLDKYLCKVIGWKE
jgi:hypothetical protein